MVSFSPGGDANARFFWSYSLLSLVFYGTFGLLTFRRKVFEGADHDHSNGQSEEDQAASPAHQSEKDGCQN